MLYKYIYIFIYIIHEAPSRKDGKLKVKLDNDNEKTFRLIKECDLQLYEGGPFHLALNHRQTKHLLNTK